MFFFLNFLYRTHVDEIIGRRDRPWTEKTKSLYRGICYTWYRDFCALLFRRGREAYWMLCRIFSR